ncbi:MAG: RNA polymerase sigma factor [Defluviitaleaceae bacterium]|nr:RNA polymerase sigma factor [Defluviitaleaceae bacterium]
MLGGSNAAFENIISQYEKLIYNLAYRIMNNHEDARDICQEVFIKVFRHIKKLDGADFVKNWICTTTHNACLDELRRRRGKAADSMDEIMDSPSRARLEPADIAPGPEGEAMRGELSEQIARAIGQLNDEQRILVVLRDIHGHSYDEIAEITQSPMGTVKSRLARARGNLRKLLENIT